MEVQMPSKYNKISQETIQQLRRYYARRNEEVKSRKPSSPPELDLPFFGKKVAKHKDWTMGQRSHYSKNYGKFVAELILDENSDKDKDDSGNGDIEEDLKSLTMETKLPLQEIKASLEKTQLDPRREKHSGEALSTQPDLRIQGDETEESDEGTNEDVFLAHREYYEGLMTEEYDLRGVPCQVAEEARRKCQEWLNRDLSGVLTEAVMVEEDKETKEWIEAKLKELNKAKEEKEQKKKERLARASRRAAGPKEVIEVMELQAKQAKQVIEKLEHSTKNTKVTMKRVESRMKEVRDAIRKRKLLKMPELLAVVKK